MKISDFNRLAEKRPDNPLIGDIFLEGDRMVGQKGQKVKGQIITFYRIIKVTGNSIEYIPIYETLTED